DGGEFRLLALDTNHEGGAAAFPGVENGLGAGETFRLGQGIPAAGDLRPDKSVDAAADAEARLRGQVLEVDPVIRRERGGTVREESAQFLSAARRRRGRGGGAAGERGAERARAEKVQKLAAVDAGQSGIRG